MPQQDGQLHFVPTPDGATFGNATSPPPPTAVPGIPTPPTVSPQAPAPQPRQPEQANPPASLFVPTPEGATYGNLPHVGATAPRQSAPSAGWLERGLEGIGKSVQGAVALPKMLIAPPQDATEMTLVNTIGPGGLSAYRLGKQFVDAAEGMLKAKPEEFQQSLKTVKELADEFHNHDFRNALASAYSLYGQIGNMTGMDPAGGRMAELAEGTRPGGNLAGPLMQSATDAALLYAGEKVPDLAEAAAAKLDKYAPKVANGLLRANKQKDFLYDKNPGKALLDPRIKPAGLESLFEQLDDIGADYGARMDAAMRDPRIAGRQYTTDIVPAINNIIDDALAQIQSTRGLTTSRTGLVDRIETIRREMLGTFDQNGNLLGLAKRTRLSPADLLEVRRGMGKSIAWDAFEKDPAIRSFVNNVQKSIYNRLNSRIETIAMRAGLDDIKTLNKSWAENIEARRLLARRIAQEENNDIGLNRLLSKSELYGGVKLMASGEPITGGLLIANRIMRTPFMRVARAQLADTTGAAITRNMSTFRLSPTAALAAVIARQQARKQEQENPPAKPTGALSRPATEATEATEPEPPGV